MRKSMMERSKIDEIAKFLCKKLEQPYCYLPCENCVLNGCCTMRRIAEIVIEYEQNVSKEPSESTGYVVPEEIPDCCAECPFRSKLEEVSVGKDLYKKICRCLLAPEEIEDPWRDIGWTTNNKEDWCPLKTVKEYLQIKGEKQ